MKSFKSILVENEFDFSHVKAAESTGTSEKSTDATVDEESEFDFSHVNKTEGEVKEDGVDTSNIHQSTRLLGIDKKKINSELKVISDTPKQTTIPLSKIKEVFTKWGIQTVFDGVKFSGKHGNKDFNLVKGGKLLKNAQLVIYWNKAEYLTLNIYVS